MPEQAMELVRQDVGLPHRAVRGRDRDPVDCVTQHLLGRDLARMEVDAGKPARVARRPRYRDGSRALPQPGVLGRGLEGEQPERRADDSRSPERPAATVSRILRAPSGGPQVVTGPARRATRFLQKRDIELLLLEQVAPRALVTGSRPTGAAPSPCSRRSTARREDCMGGARGRRRCAS
jgi:hypothetical protein